MTVKSDRGLSLEEEIVHVLAHNLKIPDSDFLVFTDASVREETVGVGWVITRNNGRIVCYGRRTFKGDYTSNQAEVLAVKCAYDQLDSMDWSDCDVKIYMDNSSVVEAFERETRLWEFEPGKEVIQELSEDAVEWISRNYNRAADALSESARLSMNYSYQAD